jgi:cellobiose phosphorylase
MKYGYFDDPNREYVITNPRTPIKWINYIGTIAFGGFVDHTGGALICKGDPTFNRITKYVQQMPSSDFKGETLYLRLKEKDGYRIFSPLCLGSTSLINSNAAWAWVTPTSSLNSWASVAM